jgi:hypothetical protein
MQVPEEFDRRNRQIRRLAAAGNLASSWKRLSPGLLK